MERRLNRHAASYSPSFTAHKQPTFRISPGFSIGVFRWHMKLSGHDFGRFRWLGGGDRTTGFEARVDFSCREEVVEGP